jgi:chromosome segregation ATPase
LDSERSLPAGHSFKRCRAEVASPQHDIQRVVESQASEIHSLKSEKSNLETSLNDLRGENERVVNENRILKRAVTIQQERQNQAVSEITSANQYKVDAEDRIKKLEHIILSLRYHLQAQQSSQHGNDFMGFPPRPPDVY